MQSLFQKKRMILSDFFFFTTYFLPYPVCLLLLLLPCVLLCVGVFLVPSFLPFYLQDDLSKLEIISKRKVSVTEVMEEVQKWAGWQEKILKIYS